ncbi:MAG: nitrate reductase associated protein [Ferruginibacter sp.]
MEDTRKTGACALNDAVDKLKLAEWSRFSVSERMELTVRECSSRGEIKAYRNYLYQLVVKCTGNEPANLIVDPTPAWANHSPVDDSLQAKAKEYNWFISTSQWKSLSDLQRFALLKLYRPGHENKNFPKAMKEFKLV